MGMLAPETKAAAERAHQLIEQAEALGEPPEDRLLLFSVLYRFWVGNFVAFNGDIARNLAAQFLAFAEKQDATIPLTVGHRIVAISLTFTGDLAQGRAHFDQAFALFNPVEHRALATRFGHDQGVAIHSYRSLALWLLGYAEAALADAEQALQHAREIGQAASLMYALFHTAMFAYFHRGDYAVTRALLDELIALADEKGSAFWKADGQMLQGCLLALTGKPSDAVHLITTAIAAWRSTGATLFVPGHLSCVARAYSELGDFDDAWRCIGEAMTAIEATKETWCEAEVNRIAGEIALRSPAGDLLEAQAHFERALAIARQQQAKSWELRASMSLARLRRNQGKVREARELLAPVYGWFTEGFDTRDLKEAKALLHSLS